MDLFAFFSAKEVPSRKKPTRHIDESLGNWQIVCGGFWYCWLPFLEIYREM